MPFETVTVNAREYRMPARPTAVITIDGCDPRYLDDALARGLMPRLAAMLENGGAYQLGRSQMPSFTNTNNMSIVTGATPLIHGLPGNHYLDPSGTEVQLSDPKFLRAPSIHKVMMEHGDRVLCVTAKDKLRRLLANGGVPATSAEKAHECPLPAYGVEDVVALVGRSESWPVRMGYEPLCPGDRSCGLPGYRAARSALPLDHGFRAACRGAGRRHGRPVFPAL